MAKYIDETKAKFLEKNIMFIHGAVNGRMVDYVYECLMKLEARDAPPIEIRIYSDGGEVGAGLDIYDAFKRYPGKKTGVVFSYARSMGAIILQACDERVCLRHAAVLIHHVNSRSMSLDVISDRKLLSAFRRDMWANQRALYAILMKRTKKTEAAIRDACKKDQDMNATEAKKFGLIDRIEDERE